MRNVGFPDSQTSYRIIKTWGSSSVTRLGDFLKILVTKFLAKEAQNVAAFLGYFLKKTYSYVNTALATFWATFGKIWATFYSNIWSPGLEANRGKQI